jgi:succinyl-diaminopimelate desuccinylase
VVNLIPAEARARFNIRFNDCHSQVSLKTLVERLAATAAGERVRWHINWEPSNADSFLLEPGPFIDLVTAAVRDVTSRVPKLSTTGGTSDARFIKNYCSVLEFGLVGQTMHQIDEHTPVADLHTLTAVYRRILGRYFGSNSLSG